MASKGLSTPFESFKTPLYSLYHNDRVDKTPLRHYCTGEDRKERRVDVNFGFFSGVKPAQERPTLRAMGLRQFL